MGKSCSPDPDPLLPHFPNPFLFIPSQIVDDFMALVPCDPVPIPPRIADVFLLLKSGKLARLDLTSFDMVKDSELTKEIKHCTYCRYFRFLVWFSNTRLDSNLMKQLLSCGENLEEFHSNMFPIFSVFENCTKLLIPRFVKPLEEIHDFENSMSERTLRSLTIVEVFYFYDMDMLNFCFHGDPFSESSVELP
ncbi:hypothetical protein AVEN_27628-1 [Araneus ventricosus]|uniref:Uncharacterized protein n=1 Tax=Araneus ventricosus TaxID=182803 RepID=A0A4Y2ER20_ARAVE|nr:hypothetical protein AVEN_27628-1 [Araneus ventricosus]